MLINQPTILPTRKVAAGGVWGAVAVGIIAGVNNLWPGVGDQLSPVIHGGIVWVTTVAASYLARERG